MMRIPTGVEMDDLLEKVASREAPAMEDADRAIARLMGEDKIRTPWGIRNMLWAAGYTIVQRY